MAYSTSVAPPQGSGQVGSNQIADDSIVNVDINSAAAIALSKLAALTSAQVIVGNVSNVPTAVAVTGDITISNAGVTAIGASKVTEAMQVLADNVTGNISNTKHGYVPKATDVLTNFLRADGAWGAPSGGGSFVLMSYRESGSVDATSDIEMTTSSISAADFDVDDIMFIVGVSEGVQGCQIYIRVNDGTNTFNSTSLSYTGADGITVELWWFKQGQLTTTKLLCSSTNFKSTAEAAKNQSVTMIANWLSSALTVSCRANNGAAGTIATIYIYKIKKT